jgi:uncharacterized protein YggL (DUF469 family)
MRKRLRKKLHRGEFQELGVRLRFEFLPDLSLDDRNKLVLDFIHEAIEQNGLQFGGGGSTNIWEGFATLDAPRGSVTEAHREKMIQWFRANPKVREYEVGPLVDAWHE